MALKRPSWNPGSVMIIEHDSKILRDNALRDPHVRDEMSRAVTDGVMALVARR